MKSGGEIIAFYISSHGYGHMTRCLAIIKELLIVTSYHIIIVCDKPQIEFARLYLEDDLYRVDFNIRKTDVGLVNHKDSLKVNKVQLEKELEVFTSQLEEVTKEEVVTLKNCKVKFIITDISILGIMVAKTLGVPVIGISNFTWYNQYKHLKLSEEIQNKFLDTYKQLDYYYEYDYALEHNFIHCSKENAGLIARLIDENKVKVIKNNSRQSAYISCGRSASLNPLTVDFEEGIIFYTKGIKINTNGIAVPLVNISDTHNYLAAASVAIVKAGWSTVAEALISGIPLVVIERKGVIEDTTIINQLKKNNLCIALSEEELEHINMEEIFQKVRKVNTLQLENNCKDLTAKILHLVREIS